MGLQVLRWLCQRNEQIVGLILHPPARQKFGDEMIACMYGNDVQIIDGSTLRENSTLDLIASLKPDIGLSVLFGYILKPALLQLLPKGCLNLHPSFLPYNRGEYPNVWSIIEGTPAGVSLHYIDEGIDTGNIVAQTQVSVEPIDTGESLYRKLESAALDLFISSWEKFCKGEVVPQIQEYSKGTFHRVKDVEAIDEIELERLYTARTLIDLLRARTFPPHHGAYFRHDGRKIYLRLELIYDETSI